MIWPWSKKPSEPEPGNVGEDVYTKIMAASTAATDEMPQARLSVRAAGALRSYLAQKLDKPLSEVPLPGQLDRAILVVDEHLPGTEVVING